MVNKSSKNKSMNVFVCVCVVYIDSETCRYQIYTEMKMKIQYLQKDLSHTASITSTNPQKSNSVSFATAVHQIKLKLEGLNSKCGINF